MSSGAEGTRVPGSDGSGLVGTVLADRYQILSLLGEGAMGFVYLGEHRRIGRRDAIKVLRPSMAHDQEAIARFTRGARNASGIRHRNVCAIYDFGTTEDGLHFLAMEYVEGGALTDVLEQSGPLPPERAASILVQAAGALEVAHERGIIHRDLKPDNIMLTRDRTGADLVKVVDFDISLGPPEGEAARVTRHGYVVGTPEYMSPEQLTGDPLDGRSDIYSLALVFFRMLTGRLPFEPGTAQEVMVRRLTEEPLSLREAAPGIDLPEALEPVVRKALARKAGERHPSASDFARGVEAALKDSGTTPLPAPSAESPGSPEAHPSQDPKDVIPRTRVSSTADVRDPVPSPERENGAEPSRPWTKPPVLIAAVAILVPVLAGLGYAAFSFAGGDDGPSTELTAQGEAPVEDPPLEEEPISPPEPDTGSEPPTESEPPTSPPAAEAEVQEAGIQLPQEPLTAVLERHLEWVALTPDPPRDRLEASRDTVQAVWDAASTSTDRALAAYVLGSVWSELGDRSRAVQWMEQAVELRPGHEPYLAELRRLRDGAW